MEVILKNVRQSFCNYFEAQAFKDNQKKSYGGKFLIPKGSELDKKIWEAINTEATAMFGKKADAVIQKHKNNNMKFCYMDGDLTGRDEDEGHMVLSAKRQETQGRPKVLNKDTTPLTPADGKPYSGCYVNAVVTIYTQKGDYEGVRSGLLGVQFAKDGDSFSGAKVASDDQFDIIEEGADADDDLVG